MDFLDEQSWRPLVIFCVIPSAIFVFFARRLGVKVARASVNSREVSIIPESFLVGQGLLLQVVHGWVFFGFCCCTGLRAYFRQAGVYPILQAL